MRSIHHRKWIVGKRRVFIVAGATVIIIMGWVFYVFFRSDSPTLETSVTPPVRVSVDSPDERPITTDNYSWKGASNEPKRLIVSSIGVTAYLQKVGVDQYGQIAVPTNVHLAGWFSESVRPGDRGLSIIDGHVDGRQVGGVFRQLDNLKIGNTFQVERGDGKLLNYTVLSVSLVDLNQAHDVLFSQDPSVISQLNLITCGGTFNKDTKSYDHRVIVKASLK